ncbi:alpha-glucosidase (family GH31 glycosyl hydrolase) [Allocatelliglobosispora scoriae]|uniref:Alpha-glucosidase (Family GH31 glycosyl hydrolase) n=1 Tax=Allocatelliglobosispora scoriae TaxID=643052 RepID=A0A841C0J0_9ACTN|nr:TIM-barrel domain-containing protein [Allocatelliglobosispora scoriae]MBB5872470.1 alpha-glucosidase (family GH31 glycosyl hydrolase) [Allocatelliglobosispora scoriae]
MRPFTRAVLAALLASTTLILVRPVAAAAATPGDVTAFSQSGNTFTIAAGSTQVRVTFARADIFRIWLAPTGTFTDPAGTDITINTSFGTTGATWSDAGTYYRINTGAVTLRVTKSPLRFAAYRPDNTTLIWSESTGLSWTGSATTQTLTRGADEQFYGTGLRLGEWALRDKTVPIKVDNGWRENNNASPAPFYLSTNGYGVLRNTWAPGSYAFGSPVATTQNENRFDAYYFIGDSLKGVLNAYTDVTGKPFLAPLWGFELGNADCFNASNPDYQGDHNRAGHQVTTDVVAYAQEARTKDMPSGWILPNDGYGCGYTNLPSAVSGLAAQGFKTGLWTSTGLSDIAWEVGTAGSRGVKTDVAWIGGGYKTAFTGVNQAVTGIEANSNARRYVWTVDGWAGTQRNAVVWTGDTYGQWDDMRWTVPAVAGAGLSALNYATGDVDGIFSGSPQTYARDLQWKAFTPAFMTMSGWGATNPSAGYNDKQPWRFAEPYLSINRKYLKLKMRLMPYHYTMSRNANLTGTPATRALVLEYPNDPIARGNTTSGEFMAGDAFLVAPVVSNTTTRDGIYLPAGTWTDYWTGQVYSGPTTLNGYSAPLDTLPLFVKGGSIVPMWPQMNYTGEKPVSTLTYDLFPRGSSSFTLYEDDGITRAYQTGSSATQQVTVTAPASGTGDVTVAVGASTGTYTGKPTSRGYEFTVHLAGAPSAIGGLAKLTTKAAYDAAATGWFFDPADRGGLLWFKAGSQSGAFSLTMTGATLPVPGPGGGGSPLIPKTGWSLVSADSQESGTPAANAFDGSTGTIWHTAWSAGVAPLPHEIQIDLGTSYSVDSLRYLPRQDGGVNGRIGQYEVYLSDSTSAWGTPVATGTFADTAAEKTVTFGAKTGRYLRLRALGEAGGRGQWTSAAEISATGTATGGPAYPSNVELVGQASSKCVDIPGGSTTPGTAPTLYTCHGLAHQRWTFQANGTLTGKSGVCLDASAPIVAIQTCTTATTQKWTANSDGRITAATGKCLTPVGNGTANGVQLELQTCTTSTSQRWTYTP